MKLALLVAFTVTLTIISGCGGMFPIIPKSVLDESVVGRAQPISQIIELRVVPRAQPSLPISFEDGMTVQPYDIETQVSTMYSEYLGYLSNPSGNERYVATVEILDLQEFREILGNEWAGNHEIHRGGTLTLNVILSKSNGVEIARRKIITKGFVGIRDKAQRGTWMNSYSNGINSAVNKSLITFDSFIRQNLTR